MDVIKTEILIIGSGASGLAASVYAAQTHIDVLVIDKGAIGKSGSTVGAVQIASLGEWSHPEDSVTTYLKDIENSGRGLSDSILARTLANDISTRINDLISWGLKLDKDDEKNVAVSATSGHSIPRSVSARKGKTGLGILQTLIKKSKSLKDHLHTWSDVITLELMKSSGRVTGAVVFDLRKNKPYIIQAKAVILAAGGIGQLYPVTSNPVQSTGDGFSLGLEVGASLVDMEQVQFYPVSLVTPSSVAGFCISFYHYSKLYNKNGHRFMSDYEPTTLENTTRDKLSIAIASEIAAGRGSENGGVWLDISDNLEKVKKEFPHEYEICMERGIDLQHGYAEIGPAAHFMMGGIHIDEHAASSVPGLYVTGETAGGLHGGNRLGNNALTECIVFGARAGMAAAKKSEELSYNDESIGESPKGNTSERVLNTIFSQRKGDIKAYEVKNKIQSIMGNYASVLRSNDGLHQAKKQLEEMVDLVDHVHITSYNFYSREILDYIEANHMLRTATVILGAAQQRKDSRGAHFNADSPSASEHVYRTSVIHENNKVLHRTTPVKGEQ